jgi:hypothetical protein
VRKESELIDAKDFGEQVNRVRGVSVEVQKRAADFVNEIKEGGS